MVAKLNLLAGLSLFATAALGQSLLTVLRQEGFTEFASLLETHNVNHTTMGNLIIYAPTNAAMQRISQYSNGLLSRRQTDHTTHSREECDYQCANVPNTGDARRRRRGQVCSDVAAPGDFMTLLGDPDFVNLPLGNNASVVQKNMPKGALPVVHSGLGDVVKVIGLDIPYDNGIIRPVSGFFTLPQLLSLTLPYLGADKALDALNRTGLLGDFDTRTGITFLAPDDSAVPSDIEEHVLAEILKRHLIVGLPVFTSDLRHGDTYKTLAGTTVTVTVQCSDVFIGGARILAGDAIIKNGVVHTVDKLLDAPIFITTTQTQVLTKTATETTQLVQTVKTVQTVTQTVEVTKSTTATETETKVKVTELPTTVTATTAVTYTSHKTHIPPPPPPDTVTVVKETTATEHYTHIKETTATEHYTYTQKAPPPPPPTSTTCTSSWPVTLSTVHKPTTKHSW